MRRWIGLSLIGIVMTMGVAETQTTTPTPSGSALPVQSAAATSTTGAFDKLSPGNQIIARALFDAQRSSATLVAPRGSSSTLSKTLSLDDIAAMKQGGRGWGEIFQELKSQGVIQQKNLGQVVSEFNHQQRTPSTPPGVAITTGSGRGHVGSGEEHRLRGRGATNSLQRVGADRVRAKGLTEKGQAEQQFRVRDANHGTWITTGSGRSHVVGARAKPEFGSGNDREHYTGSSGHGHRADDTAGAGFSSGRAGSSGHGGRGGKD